jgi:hypothetical protein
MMPHNAARATKNRTDEKRDGRTKNGTATVPEHSPPLAFLGRPGWRTLACRPKSSIIRSRQADWPKGRPFSTDFRSASTSASVCG